MKKLILTTLLSIMTTSYASAQSCGGGGCSQSPTAALQTECIDTLVREGYPLNYGNRIEICSSAKSRFGIDALKIAATKNTGISDSLLADLLNINGPLSLSCVRALADSRYDLSYGKRVEICRMANNSFGIDALKTAAESNTGISDSLLMDLLSINGPLSLGCVSTLDDSNYPLSYGKRVEICRQTSSRIALDSLAGITRANTGISDSLLTEIITINSEYADACVATLVRNRYPMDYGNRVRICKSFCTAAAIHALEAASSRNQAISDSDLRDFARIGQ